MATLVDADYTWIRDWVRNNRPIYDDVRTWGLSKSIWKTAFQTLETYMVNAFSVAPANSIRSTIEGVTGATTSQRAQDVFAIWVAWKLHNFLGG